ncbi:hypothetical protein ZIOFF_058131 [Zingiber officinale]|uniref:Reverse transcriptase n=1 Tax=Zingiber officinale TaxID=94328 RepID=A0A8J5F3G7_ZINOF|nr:hypothetical protein ZIOFF_058131 [Zingiber officinale]
MSCPKTPQKMAWLKEKLDILWRPANVGCMRRIYPRSYGQKVAIMQKSLVFKRTFVAFNYAKRLIEKFGLNDGKKWSTPLDVSARLRRDEGTCLSNPRPFRALMGSLIYLTIIRPDIAFSVGMVSRYMQEPRKPHSEEAKKILKC